VDHAVALVESYLRLNGYFTVTEYPVIEACKFGGYRTATDLDVLAFRFPVPDAYCHPAARSQEAIANYKSLLPIPIWVDSETSRTC
jgi:hypothetical protein